MPDYSIKEALELAVQTERDGAEFYALAALACSDNGELAQVFSQLSKDEKAHEAQFTSILNKMGDNLSEQEDKEQAFLLKATGASEYFKADLLKKADSISTQDALIKALNFEKATLLHYLALQDVLPENQQIPVLVKAEKAHIAALMKVIITDSKFRGLADTF